MVIQESGGTLDAIKHLDTYKDNIFDKLTILEIYGKVEYTILLISFIYFNNCKQFDFVTFLQFNLYY